jgi:hypothetical protein
MNLGHDHLNAELPDEVRPHAADGQTSPVSPVAIPISGAGRISNELWKGDKGRACVGLAIVAFAQDGSPIARVYSCRFVAFAGGRSRVSWGGEGRTAMEAG